jgi:flagellar biosynthesis component FlhA
VPAKVSWLDLCSVLEGLLEEDVGIGNLRAILRAMLLRDPARHDVADCIEMSRQALRAQITAQILDGAASLRALIASRALESRWGAALSRTASGPVMDLPPESAQAVLAAVRREMVALGTTAAGVALCVDDARIRASLRRIVKVEFPRLPVLSRLDVDPGTPLQIVGEVALLDAEAAG